MTSIPSLSSEGFCVFDENVNLNFKQMPKSETVQIFYLIMFSALFAGYPKLLKNRKNLIPLSFFMYFVFVFVMYITSLILAGVSEGQLSLFIFLS